MKLAAVFCVSLFAFLLASFPARNADLWGHLAAGRQLASDFSFSQVDGQESYLNHRGWLYDFLCYVLFANAGGAGLVLAKALLVAGTGLVLIRLSMRGTGYVLPATFTMLALLTMGTQLLLQPATVSCLFFALTLWFLQPKVQSPELGSHLTGFRTVLPPWPLLCLFVIWANLDSWFVLGLTIAALVWLGKILDGRLRGEATTQENRQPILPALFRGVLALGILGAVCLLNPYHFHAFSLPGNLWAVPRGFASPFQNAYFSSVGWTPAGLAFFPMLGLGLLSFLLNFPHWHWQRLLPWLGLAILSCFQAPAIPFFAILSAPLLTWNYLDWYKGLEKKPGLGAPRLVSSLAMALGLVLVLCAWPGWLQTPPYEPRRWAVDSNPSLERGASALNRWHREGKLGPDARLLHLSPQSAFAFSWFCPELAHTPAQAILGSSGTSSDWEARLRQAKIKHVVVFEPGNGRPARAMAKFLANPDRWPLLYQVGNLTIFGWRDPAQAKSKDLFRGQGIDLNQLAFHPKEDKKAPPNQPEPRSRRWFDAFWKSQPERSLDLDEASLHLLHAEILQANAPERNLAEWEMSQAAGLVAAAAGWTVPAGLVDFHQRLVFIRPQLPAASAAIQSLPGLDQWALGAQQMYSLGKNDTAPALLYLAIRAARRALQNNPADAQANLVLGECYWRLLHNTRERIWGTRLKQLAKLRRVQASAALNQAVLLQPDLAQAHHLLGQLYREMGYLDLALKHFRRHHNLLLKSNPGRLSEQFRNQYDLELNRLAETVLEREKKVAATGGMRVLDQAMLAEQLGLAGKARDLLLESDIAAFGKIGMVLELELLLKTGRTKEVREWTGENQKAMRGDIGDVSFFWFRAQALAASGDYATAKRELATLAIAWQGWKTVGPRERMALEIAKTVLEEQPLGGGTWAQQVWRIPRRFDFRGRVLALGRSLREEANTIVLRALLALEEGEVDDARIAFRTALALWKDEANAASGAGMDFNGRPLAQECLKWLE